MVDFSNPNICGASPELNNILEKITAAKSDAISKLDEVASAAAAAFEEAQNELAGLKDKLQTIEIPTLPKLNLQAEIASLTSQIPGTPSFISALANIKTEFEDDIKAAGLELDTLVSDATKAILGGGDVCAIIPNLEKEAGSTEPAVQKPIAPKQASVAAATEVLSEVDQNLEIEANITVIKEKIKSYNVSNNSPTEDTGAFKVADEKDVKTISAVGGKTINVICHGSNKNVSTNAGFVHRSSAGVPDNYNPDIRPLPKFDPATRKKNNLGPIENTIEEEGGYQADPTDLGNYTKENRQGKLLGTNMGITPREWAKYKRVGVDTLTADDMKNITHDEAVGFYQDRFERFGVDNYPVEVQYQIFDMTTLHGGWRKIVRDAEARPGGVTNNNLVEARLDYFDALINRKPELVKYKNGWYARAERFYA
jgi:hypothetical protein